MSFKNLLILLNFHVFLGLILIISLIDLCVVILLYAIIIVFLIDFHYTKNEKIEIKEIIMVYKLVCFLYGINF